MGLNQNTINNHLGNIDENRKSVGRKIILNNNNGRGFIYQSITKEDYELMMAALSNEEFNSVIATVRIGDIDIIGEVHTVDEKDYHYFNQYVGDKFKIGPEGQGVWFETDKVLENGKHTMSQKIYTGYEAFMNIVAMNGNHQYGVIYRFKELKI